LLHLQQKQQASEWIFMQTLKLQEKITSTQATSNKQQTSMEVGWKMHPSRKHLGKIQQQTSSKRRILVKNKKQMLKKGKQASSKQPYKLILNVVYMVR
jgi:hypothetical protein